AHRVLLGNAARAAVEQLVVADLRGGSLVLDGRAGVLPLEAGEGDGAAQPAAQQLSARSDATCACSAGGRLHQAARGVLAAAGADALADDLALGAFADVDHLGPGVGLLAVVGECDRVEFAARVVAQKHARGVLPGNRRAGLDLGPYHLAARAAAFGALGDEVVDAPAALLVARVPVLHRGVLDLGVVQRHQLHHRRVQLVLVAHGCGAALEVGHV